MLFTNMYYKTKKLKKVNAYESAKKKTINKNFFKYNSSLLRPTSMKRICI